MDHAEARLLLDRWLAAQGALYAGREDHGVEALLASGVVWSVPGENRIAGRYEGREAVMAYFLRRRDLALNSLRLHPGELLVGEGKHLAMLTEGTATVGGREHRWSTVGLYRFRDGLLAACWNLPLDQAAFDRVWS